MPAVAGLLCAGVVLGPHCLEVVGEKRPVAEFFAELGKLLLMFFAGLEINVDLFLRTRTSSLGFGLLTYALPQGLGTAAASPAVTASMRRS